MKPPIKCLWTVVAIGLGLLPLLAAAEPIIFPSGLSIDPPLDVDATYQVVPSYDAEEKVIAVWNLEKLQFFISQEKLSPDYREAKSYLPLLAADLRKAWGGIEVGRQVTVPSAEKLPIATVELSKPANPDSAGATVFVSHVARGDSVYLVLATVVPPATPDEVYPKLVKLLRTIALDAQVQTLEAAPLSH